MERKFHRILIVRTDRIGDVILTLPMAHVLKQKMPDIHVAMLIQRYTAELVDNNKDVDQILYYDEDDRPVPFFRFVNMLRYEHFDVVFHTHPRFRLALITWIARIPIRVGTGYRWYSFLFNKKIYEHRKKAHYHELEYNLHLLNAIDCLPNGIDVAPRLTADNASLNIVRALLKEFGISENEKLVLLHPGSGRSARDWHPKNFGMLAKRLSNIPNVKVMITGGKNEQALICSVQSIAGDSVVSLVDRLSIHEYSALAYNASLFISNSTGPIHIAAAVGTPVIGLYPHIPVLSDARWGPYTEKKTIFSPKGKPFNCNKCLHNINGLCECMDSISVDDVYYAAVKYLSKSSL